MAAILAADAVGYSRLMGTDEERTLAVLKDYREVLDGLIASHGGRVFGSAGDSVIAEFASPVEAVRCATDIQLEIDKRNTLLPEADRLRFRIGINLGDVVVDGGNLMGDGVNVAARLEGLSQPGGICISEAIYSQVRDRLSLDFLDLGELRVKNIARPVHAYRIPLTSEEQIKSPFRGLDAFEFENANLFFGRARAIAICVERLEQLAAGGKAFLLIYGMSGSGKSSLLRAGLLPSLVRSGAVAGIALWRRCLVRPSEGPDAVTSLAAALLRDGALPELAQDQKAMDLVGLFRSTPEQAPALIRQALGKAAATAGVSPSQARLIVGVDQIEELFTTEVEPASREIFVRLLTTFAGSGFVWVIGTIRADFFHRCSEIAGFSALRDGLSSYELLPPTGPEIAQIIREPARATGLRFEETADQGRLDDVLQAAAAADSGSLPLLEFVLNALYESGRERRFLTFAAYRALGGLEGAIARRADEVVDVLPAEIQDALPAVLRALTTVRPSDEAVTARPASLAEIAGTPARSTLVDALIAARLLVSDEDVAGRSVVRVAHEALLIRWPRARTIITSNRSFLEARARLQTEARRWWSDNKNPELLLPPGKRLAEGEDLLLSRQEEVDDQIVEYIKASSSAQKVKVERDRQTERKLFEAAETAKRERLERETERLAAEAERRRLAATAATRLARRTRYAALIALALAVIAGFSALVGFWGQQEATRQSDLAESSANLAKAAEKQARHAESQAREAEMQARAAEEKALQARDEALRNQSLSLSFLSQQAVADGDIEAGILLALEALPRNVASPERPFVIEAETALYQALLQHKNVMVFHHDAGLTDAVFNKNGDRIVTASYDKTARIWSIEDGSEVAILKGHQDALERATFSPDGSQVVTAARDGTARIWDAGSGKQLSVLPLPGDLPTAMFSPDGKRVLTASRGSRGPVIWDAQTGKEVIAVPDIPLSGYASFSPDGRSFAAIASGHTIRVWNAEDGVPIKALSMHGAWPDDVTFSPDGKRILASNWRTVSNISTVSLLWDVSSGTKIATLGGHKSDTRSGVFSHDGRLVATVSIDGTARLWDGVTGRLISTLGEESRGLVLSDAGIEVRDQEINAAFSPDDQFLATVSMDGVVHIWDVITGSQFAVIRGHTGLVEHVAYSPTGDLLLTASHDGTARLWDLDGILTTTLRHQKPPTFAAFSPDGTRVVTGGHNRVGHIWDVASGSEITRLETNGGSLQDAAFSPDGHHVATASYGGSIAIWDAASGRQVIRLKGHDSAVRQVQFDPKGDTLLSTSVDGTARLWNVSTGHQLSVFKADGYLQRALFSSDGQLILTAVNDNTARIWKTDGSEFRSLIGHENKVTAAAFSSDGQLVATGSLDGTAKIWSLADGRVVATLKGHDKALTDVAFSRDSQLIVTTSRDGTARIWRVRDGTKTVILEGNGAFMSSAAFSANGSYVVTASAADRAISLWDASSGREVAVLTARQRMAIGNPAPTRAVFNADGTRIVVFSGEETARIVRVFPTTGDLISYARKIAPRAFTPCERKRFFLPVEGEVGECQN